jgi:mannose/fructose-specific phosphotransferase system component IIA
MNEGPPVRGIVIGHGALADGLVDAVRQITGAGEEVLVPLSNRGLSPETLVAEVRRRTDDAPAVIFTDLPSGSCSLAARRLCHERRNLVAIGGVNLPLLLEFVVHRHLPLEELARRLVEKGRAGITCTPADLEAYARRAVSS